MTLDLGDGDDRPYVGLRTALVLREAESQRWIASYDPYTAEQNLPEDVSAGEPGAAHSWADFDGARLQSMLVELLGVNTTPAADTPTWDPKGLYSDWADEHHVTPTSMILYYASRNSWTSAGAPTPGR